MSLTKYSDSLYIGLLDIMGEKFMEESNKTQKETVRAIVVQKDALQKPLKHGLSITLSYDFIKTFKPEYAEMSDSDLRKVLSGMSQEQLSDLFAGGVYVMTEQTVEQIPGIIPIGIPGQEGPAKGESIDEPEDVIEETPEDTVENVPGENLADKPEEKKEENKEDKKPHRKRWLALLLVIPLALMLKQCPGPDRGAPDELPPEPPGIETVIEDEEVDKEIIDYLGEVPPIVIHNPTDATQDIKTLTDLGNQEFESNIRKEGASTDGAEMWEKENSAVEGYEENKAHMDKMKALMETVNDPNATPAEKQQALLDMQEHALALYEKYDMKEIQDLQAYTSEQLFKHKDSISETEEKIAADAVQNYETDMGTQKNNIITLAYIQYLSDFGYDITSMEVEIQADGDLVISGIQGQRTILESEKDNKPKSITEFRKMVEAAMEQGEPVTEAVKNVASGKLYAITDYTGLENLEKGEEGTYVDPVFGEEGTYEDPIAPTEQTKNDKVTPGIDIGDEGLRISVEDLQKLAKERNMNPKKVEAAIKAMTNAMAEKDKNPERNKDPEKNEDGRNA